MFGSLTVKGSDIAHSDKDPDRKGSEDRFYRLSVKGRANVLLSKKLVLAERLLRIQALFGVHRVPSAKLYGSAAVSLGLIFVGVIRPKMPKLRFSRSHELTSSRPRLALSCTRREKTALDFILVPYSRAYVECASSTILQLF